MNLKKAIFLIAILAVAHIGYSQIREETLGPNSPDPVKQVQVYPNPAVEFLSLKFETPLAKKVRLTVHNILGNTLEVETEVVDEHEIKLKVKDLATGYYFVSVRDDQAALRGTYKFLKR
ncbi:MAG TPA: T9SS type A sorting domain-containing protein [Cyclobacteriaceae bacterium]|nr:T9SS type A sorting domain-containing protein [Cyclobacteriaceae bacterium]